MDQVTPDSTYKDLYGRLTAFLQKLYESAQKSEASIIRELNYAEKSETDVARAKAEALRSLLAQREIVTTLLELLLRKTLKEERVSRLAETDRALFEAIYSSPEGERFGVEIDNSRTTQSRQKES